MRTNLQAIQIAFDQLHASALKAALSGSIYKTERPINSSQEDCVINALPMTTGQEQECVINVNIYVPNLILQLNGEPTYNHPNLIRLEELTLIATSALEDKWGADWNMEVQHVALFEEPEIKQHYQNIRVQFYSTNL